MLKYCALLLLLATLQLPAQKIMVTDLTCEHKVNPMGVDVTPRLSWKLNGTGRNIMQAAYSIKVATDINFSTKHIRDFTMSG